MVIKKLVHLRNFKKKLKKRQYLSKDTDCIKQAKKDSSLSYGETCPAMDNGSTKWAHTFDNPCLIDNFGKGIIEVSDSCLTEINQLDDEKFGFENNNTEDDDWH